MNCTACRCIQAWLSNRVCCMTYFEQPHCEACDYTVVYLALCTNKQCLYSSVAAELTLP